MLGCVFLIANIINCLYAALGLAAPSAFVLLYYIAAFWAIAAWIIADARRLRVNVPFDIGWFVFLAWPVALPYHLFKTRGVRGFLTLAGLLGLFLATYVVGLAVFFVIVSLRSTGWLS